MKRLPTAIASLAIAMIAIAATAALYLFADLEVENTKLTNATTQQPSVPVTAAPVTTKTVQRIVPIVGTLYGLEEVPIDPKVAGRIVRIHHDVGDRVKPGDVLFEIDPTEYRLRVNEAERSLDLELSKLGLKTLPSKNDDVNINRLPSVVRAASQLKLAEIEFERAKTLLSQRTISQADFDKWQTDLALAKANFEQALLDAQTDLASARWKQAAYESAKSDLAETRVTAPPQSELMTTTHPNTEYVVAERTITEGEIVHPTAAQARPAFRLVIADPLKLKAAVAERFKTEVRVGLPVGALTEATGNTLFLGTVKRVNPTVDRASRTFQIEVEIPNPERKLAAGSFAKAGIRTRLDDSARTVPAEAIVRFAGVVKVFAIRDGIARAVPIEVGEKVDSQEDQSSTWVEVVGDLNPGEPVVTSGHSQLADGTPVKLRGNDQTPPNPEPNS